MPARSHILLTRTIRQSLVGAILAALILLPAGPGAAIDDGTRETGFQPTAIAITGATLMVAPGTIAENATLVIRDGRIVAIGEKVTAPSDAEVIDGKGLYVYPGFIDAACRTLVDAKKLPETNVGRTPDFNRDILAATRSDNRRGLFPEFLLADALLHDDSRIAARRGAGITDVHVITTDQIAGGQGCLLSLSSLPDRESLLHPSTGVLFKLAPPSFTGTSTLNYPITIMGSVAHLRQAFLDARHHREQQRRDTARPGSVPKPPVDPTWETLNKVLDGELRPIFLADTVDEIDRALDFCREYELRPIILGGSEAADRIDRLKAESDGVILIVNFGTEPKVEPPKSGGKLEATFKSPTAYQEFQLAEWKRRVTTAGKLREAGVPFAFGSQGLEKADDWLTLLRTVVKHGVDAETVLAGMTLEAAKLLGVSERLGTLSRTRLGHVVVMTGPWDNERSKVRYVVVNGRVFEYNKTSAPLAPSSNTEAPQLAGRWQVTIESGDMRTVDATLDLQQSGRKLTGTFSSQHGNGTVDTGTIRDKGADLRVGIGAGDRKLTLEFQIELPDPSESLEQLTGTLKSPFGPESRWTAVRGEEPSQPKNPVQLSLEDDAAAKQDGKLNELPVELESDRRRREPATSGNLLLRNATIYPVTGPVIEKGDILIRDGRFAEIGQNLKADEGMTVIDLKGRHAMPGLIDTHSHIMIAGGVNESSQSVVPEVRVSDVLRSDDAGEYRALAGGLTTARLLHGSANTIGGQHAVVKLRYGEPAAKHLVADAPLGVKFALGENVKARTGRFPNTRMGVEATIRRAFYEAIEYRRQWQAYERAVSRNKAAVATRLPPRRDLRLEALSRMLDHEILIHSHCYRADEILMLLRTAEQFGIRIQSLQHVLEGYKIAPEIAAHGASCSTFSDWWAYKVEAYDAIPFNTSLLNKAGVNTVIKSDDRELMRHMNLEAAKSLRYGNMSPEDAMKLVTINPARELRLDDRIGSIEVGKDADLAIFNGHPFNPYSRCELTIIDGEIRFRRESQPTAMSVAARERTESPPPLVLAADDVRERKLDIPVSAEGTYIIRGATVHPVDGPAIEEGVVIVTDGRIEAVGSREALADRTRSDAVEVDATGMHVYPGLIDVGTTLGLYEFGQVGATVDVTETGRIQPDVRAGIAVNVDSELIPVARAGGITTALLRPSGMTVAGQCSLLQTAGWTSEEMILDYEAGLSVDWPSLKDQLDDFKSFLKEARVYDKVRSQPENRQRPIIRDPRHEAMRPYLKGEKRLFIAAESRKAIAEALLFAEEEKLKIVIVGGTDAWKLADELKRRDVPVVVGPTMRSPLEAWDPFDATYANPGRLHEAGVLFCIRSEKVFNSRNAPLEAAIAVAYGLPEDEAIKSVTLNAARILGVEKTLGSITPGKMANLIVTDGCPLQHPTQIKAVFVSGHPYPPESRQTELYERYLKRLPQAAAQSK